MEMKHTELIFYEIICLLWQSYYDQKNVWKFIWKFVLTIIHSHVKGESVFSHMRKNLASQSASLQMSRFLSSVFRFQRNKPNRQTYCQYNPSKDIIENAKRLHGNTTNSIAVGRLF